MYDWGYYSLPLTKANGQSVGSTPVKIINLNNNFCYELNWAAVFSSYTDPGDQLAWLE